MTTTRRRFLRAGLVGSGALAAGSVALRSQAKAFKQPGAQPMSILLLGGTGFIGPHMVREALRRGHSVTLFNRGKTNNALFPDLATLIGDRDGKLDALKGQRWDLVIDNSGYVPRHVQDSARLLADAANYYLYISTISAYDSLAEPIDETAPLATLEDESVEDVTGETYGPLKALCEQRAADEFGGDRLGIIRPTYICGPGDHTDRYSWWPVRSAAGGTMLRPGRRGDLTQIIDVRDLAIFTLDMAEQRLQGAFNAVTPAGQFSMGDLLDDCLAITGNDLQPVWVPHDFLDGRDLGDRRNPLPIWNPPGPESAGFGRINGEKAVAAGLRNRPTRETARDTLAWWQNQSSERHAAIRAGLPPEVERQLLEAWEAKA